MQKTIDKLSEILETLKREDEISSSNHIEISSILSNIEKTIGINCFEEYKNNYNLKRFGKEEMIKEAMQNIIRQLSNLIIELQTKYRILIIKEDEHIVEENVPKNIEDVPQIIDIHESKVITDFDDEKEKENIAFVNSNDKDENSNCGNSDKCIHNKKSKRQLKSNNKNKLFVLSAIIGIIIATVCIYLLNNYINTKLEEKLNDPEIQKKFKGEPGKDGPKTSDVTETLVKDEKFLNRILALMASEKDQKFRGPKGDTAEIDKVILLINKLEQQQGITTIGNDTIGWLQIGRTLICWGQTLLVPNPDSTKGNVWHFTSRFPKSFENPPQIIHTFKGLSTEQSFEIIDLSTTKTEYTGSLRLSIKKKYNKANQLTISYIAIGIPSILTPPLEKSALSSLQREEERDKAKLEFLKENIDINCFKKAIILSLKKNNFQLRLPIFDEDDRLQTHVRNTRGSLYPEQNYFEETVIAMHISEKDDKYRLYAVTRGDYRRRQNDLESAEDISAQLMEELTDKVISDVDYNQCLINNKVRLSLSWNTHSDIDLHVMTPTHEVCYYRNKKITIGYLNQDNTMGPEHGAEVFTLEKGLPGSYLVKIHYFSGKIPTETLLQVMDNSGIHKYNSLLEQEGESIIFHFSYENGMFNLINKITKKWDIGGWDND